MADIIKIICWELKFAYCGMRMSIEYYDEMIDWELLKVKDQKEKNLQYIRYAYYDKQYLYCVMGGVLPIPNI